MKKNTKPYLIIGILLLVVALVFATSYALFVLNITENNDFKVAIGNLELKIDDADSTDITLDYLIPTDDDLTSKDGYTFTLRNIGSIESKYYIYLEDIIAESDLERLDNDYIKVNIWDSVTDTNVMNYYSYYSDKPIAEGTLEPNDSIDFELKLWLDYDAGNDAQGKYFATRIKVTAYQANEIIEETNEE